MADPLIGVQLGPHSVYDEGVDRCLDLLQRSAAVNTPFVYSHTYYTAKGRAPAALADDHGVPVRDERKRRLAQVWHTPNDRCYAGTALRHPAEPDAEYGDRDVFETLLEPCRRRGMKLYARILEPWGEVIVRSVVNGHLAMGVDPHGRRSGAPCWNNPHWRHFWLGTVEDLFKTYPIDGLQYGAERVPPMSHLLSWRKMSACFCAHCRRRAEAKGVDVEEARRGFIELQRFVAAAAAGEPRPTDGRFITFLRILMRHPAMLAWERDTYAAYVEHLGDLYGAVKLIRPEARFGIHVDHQQSTYNIFHRAIADLRSLGRCCDFIKPILYHDIAGPRIHNTITERWGRLVFGELAPEARLAMFYAMVGYEGAPTLDELTRRGLSPRYVHRETRRFIEAAAGEADVIPGIGIDIAGGTGWGTERFATDPETVFEAVNEAFDAGAAGILVSREYDEMRVPNLEAVGRAVRGRR